jgi:hypothetical protein
VKERVGDSARGQKQESGIEEPELQIPVPMEPGRVTQGRDSASPE